MRARIGWLLLASLSLLVTSLPPSTVLYASVKAADSVIYDDAIVDPWEGTGWSYGTTVDLASAVHHTGSKGIAVTHDDDGGAFKVHISPSLPGTDYGSISFWVFGAAGGSPINLFIGDTAAAEDIHGFTAPAGVWTQYNVPLSDLGSPAAIDSVNWQGAGGAAQPTYYLDDIRVVAASATTGFPDATADGHHIVDPGPSGVAVAPNGRVYVASYHADVVYSWPSAASTISLDSPDKIFGSTVGDPDGPAGCTTTQSDTVMCGPESIAVDSNGNLFVADTYHHRILVFLNPDTDVADPLVADAVLGQPDFVTADPNYDSSPVDSVKEGFCYVRGLAVDADDHLWAVDEFNFRVISFNTPLVSSSLPNRVFGQPDLGTTPAACDPNASGGSGAAQFGLPLGVAVDQQGAVFVTDFNNNRIQRFAATAANGAAAEESYTSTAGLDHPHDLAVDASGNLYVANTFGNELLVFEGGASGDLASDHTFPGRNYPMGMAFTAKGDLLVADCGAPEANTDYPPCVPKGPGQRGVYFFAAPAAPTFQPPTANDDKFQMTMNTALHGNVLSNDRDPAKSPLTVVNVLDADFGTTEVAANGVFTFTPESDFVGLTHFFYTIRNNGNLTDTASVEIKVVDAPAELESKTFVPALRR